MLDRLELPRPCIDAQNVGFNVEWSQELTLDESLVEYAAGWPLIHVAADLLALPAAARATQLEVSVGYSLDGIRERRGAHVAPSLARRAPAPRRGAASLPPDLRARIAHVDVPDEPYDCITLSDVPRLPRRRD